MKRENRRTGARVGRDSRFDYTPDFLTSSRFLERSTMENQYSIRIGNTNFIVSVKQSETAKKPMDTAFRGLCVHEVLGDCFASDKFNLEEIKKSS